MYVSVCSSVFACALRCVALCCVRRSRSALDKRREGENERIYEWERNKRVDRLGTATREKEKRERRESRERRNKNGSSSSAFFEHGNRKSIFYDVNGDNGDSRWFVREREEEEEKTEIFSNAEISANTLCHRTRQRLIFFLSALELCVELKTTREKRERREEVRSSLFSSSSYSPLGLAKNEKTGEENLMSFSAYKAKKRPRRCRTTMLIVSRVETSTASSSFSSSKEELFFLSLSLHRNTHWWMKRI